MIATILLLLLIWSLVFILIVLIGISNLLANMQLEFSEEEEPKNWCEVCGHNENCSTCLRDKFELIRSN